MSKVKQWAWDSAEKESDEIILDFCQGNISFDVAKEIFNNGTKNLAPFSNFIKNLSENFSIIYGIISIIFAIVLGISAAFIRRFFSNLRKKYMQKN